MKTVALLALAWWFFFYFDPETNVTTRIGPFLRPSQCEAFRADLKAAASPLLHFSACWVVGDL